MGLFKKKKSLKELAKEKYSAKSLQELSAIIGNGLEDKNEPATIDEKFWLAEVYLEKLICADISENGFGYKDISTALNVISSTDEFIFSVYTNGIYKRKSTFGGEVIQNYRLEFLKNYLCAKNTTPLKKDWVQLIFKIYDDTQDDNTDNGTITQDNLKDLHCPIYDPWVYQGNDNDFINYKIKVAILFCNEDFVKKYGLLKDGNATSTHNTVCTTSDKYITFEDVKNFTSKDEISNFFDDCQTIDN